MSCATCHDPDRGYSSFPAPRLGGGSLTLKAPSLLNRKDGKSFFWDGRAHTLEDQALEVMANPNEMGGPLETTLARVRSKYPDIGESKDIAVALAAFERTLTTPQNKLDGYLAGDNRIEMTDSQVRGWNLFRGEAQCYKCHTGRNFTDEKLHDTGLGGRFKTPGLRGVKATAPYMHDGSKRTLLDVIYHYSLGTPESKSFDLTQDEYRDLEAFLKSL